MGVGQCVGHFPDDADGVGYRKLPFAAETVGQRLAFDIRPDVVPQALRLAAVVERQNVGMMELGDDPDFPGNRSAPRAAASSGRRTLTATLRSCLRPPDPSSRSRR